MTLPPVTNPWHCRCKIVSRHSITRVMQPRRRTKWRLAIIVLLLVVVVVIIVAMTTWTLRKRQPTRPLRHRYKTIPPCTNNKCATLHLPRRHRDWATYLPRLPEAFYVLRPTIICCRLPSNWMRPLPRPPCARIVWKIMTIKPFRIVTMSPSL